MLLFYSPARQGLDGGIVKFSKKAWSTGPGFDFMQKGDACRGRTDGIVESYAIEYSKPKAAIGLFIFLTF